MAKKVSQAAKTNKFKALAEIKQTEQAYCDPSPLKIIELFGKNEDLQDIDNNLVMPSTTNPEVTRSIEAEKV